MSLRKLHSLNSTVQTSVETTKTVGFMILLLQVLAFIDTLRFSEGYEGTHQAFVITFAFTPLGT